MSGAKTNCQLQIFRARSADVLVLAIDLSESQVAALVQARGIDPVPGGDIRLDDQLNFYLSESEP